MTEIINGDSKMETIMKVECAWCGADLGEKDGKGETGTTHGICQDCIDKYFSPEVLRKNEGEGESP